MGRFVSVLAVMPYVCLVAAADTQAARGETVLFPETFRVVHHLEQDDGDGERFVSDSVVDTYGGSWLVSERPDGSRVIVDFTRRELTEVSPARGVFWSVTYDRLAELTAYQRSVGGAGGAMGFAVTGSTGDNGGSGAAASLATTNSASPAPRLEVHEVEIGVADAAVATALVQGIDSETSDSLVTPGGGGTSSPSAARAATLGSLRRLRVGGAEPGGSAATLDVWVTPALRLSPAAVDALAAFEAGVGGRSHGPQRSEAATAGVGDGSPAAYLTAARRYADGAMPLRTVRPLFAPEDSPGSPFANKNGTATREVAAPRVVGSLADVVTKVERLDRFPVELVLVPEGLRRVPHPLESAVRLLEEERSLDRTLAGGTEAP